LKENPGPEREMGALTRDAYDTARALAERDTGQDERVFPAELPGSPEQLLAEAFWPATQTPRTE